MGGKRNPFFKEKAIYEYIKEQSEPVSFHQIQKQLSEEHGFSVGAIQAAIDRCTKEGAYFPIFEKKVISPQTNRNIRVFSTYPEDLVTISDPSMEELLNIYGNVQSGKLIQFNQEAILPLYLKLDQAKILQNLVHLNPDYQSIGDLFSQAVMDLLSSKVSKEQIQEAMNLIREETSEENSDMDAEESEGRKEQ